MDSKASLILSTIPRTALDQWDVRASKTNEKTVLALYSRVYSGDELQLQAEDEGEFEDTSASGTVWCIPDRKRKRTNDCGVLYQA